MRKRKTNPLGKLSVFGLTQPWQVTLLLPEGWVDYRSPVNHIFEPAEGQEVVLTGQLAFDAYTDFHNNVPRLKGEILDTAGQPFRFILFGDQRETAKQLTAGSTVTLHGQLQQFSDHWYLTKVEIVQPEWMGKLWPRYPGKRGVIKSETVRERVLSLLPGELDQAVMELASKLERAKLPVPTMNIQDGEIVGLEHILLNAHLPKTIEEGEHAQAIIEYTAACLAVAEARQNRPTAAARQSFAFDWEKIRQRVKRFPHKLTEEQRKAAFDGLQDMGNPVPMRRILSGDVGTGKTAVYLVMAAAVADHGGRVAILAPTQPLAAQIGDEIKELWPDIPFAFVGGEADDTDYEQAQILVGTTALLHRPTGALDLVIVDEQQKFSRDQRERLTTQGVHLLEASGTCIPRSMALIRYGVWAVSRLSRPHVEKQIQSRLWGQNERGGLMKAINKSIGRGDQVLVVYPLKESDDVSSAEQAYKLWEKQFPGRVRMVHANMEDTEKQSAITAMKTRQADLLVSTTVVEVGLNIPDLRHVVVVEPQRLGLTQLHQIRGRVARLGGAGWFSMYPRTPLKEHSQKRLAVMLETNDGFEIAQRDLELRGYGSLNAEADRQSGHDELLFGRPVKLELLDQAVKELEDGNPINGG